MEVRESMWECRVVQHLLMSVVLGLDMWSQEPTCQRAFPLHHLDGDNMGKGSGDYNNFVFKEMWTFTSDT